MAGISSPGLGSGLDVKSIVAQLVALERKPIEKVQAERKSTETRLSSFGLLQSYTVNIRDAAKKLASAETWKKATASSSNEAAVAATSTSNTASGSYSIEVSQLARAQGLASPLYGSASSPVGSGTLTIQLGAWSTGVPPTFTPKAGASATPITITNTPAGSDSLESVRDSINAAEAGVTASIVNDGAGYRLVLRSSATGEENAVKITATGDASLSNLAYSPDEASTGAMSQTVSARNAQAVINGLAISSSSNTLDATITGLTLTLKQTTTTPVDVSVSKDSAAMRTAVDDFVKAYNALNTYITEQTKYDPNTKVAGKLQGDASVRSLQSQLRTLAQASSGASATLSRLSSVGIETQRDGSLMVSSSKFEAALTSPTTLALAFTNDAVGDANDGFGVRFSTLTTTLTDTGGLLDSRSEGLRNQMKRHDEQIARLEDRVSRTEARLLQQYNTLDSNIGKLNSLGSYVNQQVTAWNNAGKR